MKKAKVRKKAKKRMRKSKLFFSFLTSKRKSLLTSVGVSVTLSLVSHTHSRNLCENSFVN